MNADEDEAEAEGGVEESTELECEEPEFDSEMFQEEFCEAADSMESGMRMERV